MSTTPGKPRIVHFIHDDGPGGGPVAIRNLAERLRDTYDIEFVHGGRGLLHAYALQHGLRSTSIPMNRKWKIPAGFLALTWQLIRRKPDVLFLHGQWAGPVGALAGALAGVKRMVYVCHFPSFYTDWDLFRVVRNRIAEAIPCRFATKVVVLSEGNYYQYLVRRLISENQAELIRNAVPPDEVISETMRRQIREEYHWNDGDCHVVSVGRLADQKRMDWLLKSWKLVCSAEPRARLWIVGGGPDEEKLKRMAADLNLTGCTFLGPQPRGDRFIAAADVIAMTTIYEGHAHIPLEAMLNARPIVANAVDGVLISFTDGIEGYLVQPGDIQGFADRLLKLIRSPELREEMGRRGVERAKYFHPDTIFTKFRTMLAELLNPPEQNR